jgi:hypothetical protein
MSVRLALAKRMVYVRSLDNALELVERMGQVLARVT